MNKDYEVAREAYAKIGIDTEKAIETLKNIPISMHCWQGDDVVGFVKGAGAASGGILATGNYPGRARNPEELMADIDQALSLIPGKHRINLHASYAIMNPGEEVDRDKLEPKHFAKWVEFAKARDLKLDFNATMYSHPMVKNGLTLSSPDETVRKFWIDHTICCMKIAEYFGKELNAECQLNIWIPDGFKDIPADRLSPRARLKDSLDKIFAYHYDKMYCVPSVESKVFGIGVEACTVGSHEFYMNYAAKNNLLCLLDAGHFHPTEVISDKIPSMLLFSDKLALHVSRPIRWDSDHVIRFDDELREIAKEIVRCDAIDRVYIALDYFDASINRVAAWVIGMRNMQKALLYALLLPHKELAALQDQAKFTELLARQEELKLYPYGEVYNEFCARCHVPAQADWFKQIRKYEQDVQFKRG